MTSPCMTPPASCSHRRAVLYFLHSILEPRLFPSMVPRRLHPPPPRAQACSSVQRCNRRAGEGPVVAHMGEGAAEGWRRGGERRLLYTPIHHCHWDWHTHTDKCIKTSDEDKLKNLLSKIFSN